MKIFALVIAASVGSVSGLWLEEAGISVIGSINIAIAVAYSWYLLIKNTCYENM